MFNKLLQSIWTSIGWTLLIFILLVIPQQDIPGHDIFNITDFDKIVHAALFGIFVWVWASWYSGNVNEHVFNSTLVFITIIGCIYGIGMEIIQKYFTSRKFDNGDILADITGAIAGALIFKWFKKISPYRNRGRNQN